ncbi:glutamyl endopeptidase [Niallia circulans]|jgi:glutamyl endopeptidase|uniref:trypsin-like serine peptidase n=1 Tax=Shouchella clausii TaxID=79880 RepID=UPI000BA6023D|nr:trypsin-like peptidase domain-containing protein [Shouchella clausii]MCM3549571.1 trypsin-like peptidase domain-containing protein [Shouchella clausii]PAF13563.1 hypothetical protein CHH59_13055 [Shouchella clausii]SPT79263.1 glutamyl endopeptidase [Niallia circulans]
MKLLSKLVFSTLLMIGGQATITNVSLADESIKNDQSSETNYIQYDLETQTQTIISIGDETELGEEKFSSPEVVGTGEMEKVDLNSIGASDKTPIDPLTGQPLEEKITPFVIIGEDDRRQVANTSIMPYRALTYIEFANLLNTWTCSGGVIGIDLVVTNAHCVDRTVFSSTVVPGINNNQWAYGHYRVTHILYPQEYRETQSSDYDYAILRVAPDSEGRHIGNRAGILSWSEAGSITENTLLKTYGYPGDKISENRSISMWGMTGRSDSFTHPNLVFYNMDTYFGQSGSPVLNSTNTMIAVHNAGYKIGNRDINGGPKIRRHFTNLFNQMNQ